METTLFPSKCTVGTIHGQMPLWADHLGHLVWIRKTVRVTMETRGAERLPSVSAATGKIFPDQLEAESAARRRRGLRITVLIPSSPTVQCVVADGDGLLRVMDVMIPPMSARRTTARRRPPATGSPRVAGERAPEASPTWEAAPRTLRRSRAADRTIAHG